MAVQKLPAGYEIESVTRGELGEELDRHTRNWFQELARGLTHARFPNLSQSPNSGAVSFPSTVNNDPTIGPKPGNAWAVQRVSAFGLAANDVLSVFRNTAVGQNFYGNITATTGYLHIGGKGIILHDKETLTVTGASLSATLVTLTGEAIECSELDFYKLIG